MIEFEFISVKTTLFLIKNWLYDSDSLYSILGILEHTIAIYADFPWILRHG